MSDTNGADDHRYIKPLENWCILAQCQPAQAWVEAYEAGYFTIGEWLESEAERLGIDLRDSDAVQKRAGEKRENSP